MKLPFEVEPLGIRFSRFASADCELHAAWWRDADGNISHVYSARLRRDGGGWEAALEADGREFARVQCGSAGRGMCRILALSAMRGYLLRGHRRTLRALREEEARALEAWEAGLEGGAGAPAADKAPEEEGGAE